MTPKVSVIIPVYNTEDDLGACLDSVLMQSMDDLEIICVDDGSKDGSLDVLKNYAFLDERLKVLSQDHAGAGAARNKGLTEAKGEFVCFLNSADLFDPELLQKMVQSAEENKADVVMCGYKVLDAAINGITTSQLLKNAMPNNNPCRPADLNDELFQTFPDIIWNRLIRHDLIRKLHLQFDESVESMSDWSFNAMVLAGADKISWISEDLFCHKINFRLPKKEDVLQKFENELKGVLGVYHKLNEVSLYKTFEMPYYYMLKKMVCESLEALPTDKRGEATRLILKHLPKNLLDLLAMPSQYRPKVSLIVPVYNAEQFLSECLDSLIHQTLKEIEIICVNDGSTDASLDILNEYAKKDNRIQVLSQENKGQAMARNAAMEVATGTYIQFVDTDDILEPDACEVLYLYARIFYFDMLSFSAIDFLDKTKEEFENPYHTLSWLPEKQEILLSWRSITEDMPKLAVTACLTIYRRMFLVKNGLHWLNKKVFFEDTPFFVEAAFKNSVIGALKIPLYRRRVYPQAVTQQMGQNFSDLIFAYKYTLDLLKKMKIPNSIIVAYVETFFNKVYLNYIRLPKEDEEKNAIHLYKFGLYVLKKYHIQLPDKFLDWTKDYLKNKKLKKKAQFTFFRLLSKLYKKQYALSLFELKKWPDVSLKILSIPVFEFQARFGELRSWTLKILGYKVASLKESWED